MNEEICENLQACELYPKEWIREVGDRIIVPKTIDKSVFAYLWHRAGLNDKQVRKLVGMYCGNLPTYWSLGRMIDEGRKIVTTRREIKNYIASRSLRDYKFRRGGKKGEANDQR